MREHDDWRTWPGWMSKDVHRLVMVCGIIRVSGLCHLARWLEDGLTPPDARERFGLSLEAWEPVERAITDGIIEQARDGAIVPPHIRAWLDSGRGCQ